MSQFPPKDPWTTTAEVADGLAEIEAHFRERGDRRAVFATAYALITDEIISRIAAGSLRDPPWVARYLIGFAELYRKALVGHLGGSGIGIAPAWQVALDASAEGRALVIQDLLLGINAHINHDLPLALETAGLGDSLADKYADHTAVNLALEATTGAVQDRIAAYYARGLGVLDDLLLFLDEEIAQIGFAESRERSWLQGRALATAGSVAERAAIVTGLRETSGTLARRILAPNGRMPWLIHLLGFLENRFPWPLSRDDTEALVFALEAAGPPSTIDELITALLDVMTGMDAARDRLSIYVSTYLRNTRKVKTALETGQFKDPDWMEQLDLRFGAMYLAYIEAYRAGQGAALPRCWRRALQEIALGETTIVQDAVLQVIPRVIYDLPIGLHAIGMETNLEVRHHDYELTYDFFLLDFDEIQVAMARKYSPVLRIMDIVGGPIDEWLTDRLYRQARAEAWADSLRLQAAPDDLARQEIIAELDERALDAVKRFASTENPIGRNAARLVRGLEDRFPGDWTGEI